MSGPVDPATGQHLPADALQRVLFVARSVHIYAIPPLVSMKGYTAADWTKVDQQTGKTRQIFTGRLRIVETAIPLSSIAGEGGKEEGEKVKADILLEDPDNGSLFAAAPYTDPGAVEHVLDSSRFFAIRVVASDGRKAVLGIGFEDRSEAFDFGVALQEASKILGFGQSGDTGEKSNDARKYPGVSGNAVSDSGKATSSPKDYSLEPGQTISINMGNRRPANDSKESTTSQADEKALFSIAPPPPPASINSVASGELGERRRRRPASAIITEPVVTDGFDDSDSLFK